MLEPANNLGCGVYIISPSPQLFLINNHIRWVIRCLPRVPSHRFPGYLPRSVLACTSTDDIITARVCVGVGVGVGVCVCGIKGNHILQG